MPISGSQTAPTQCRLGVMRLGATRLGFFYPNFLITVGGVDRSAGGCRVSGLSIEDLLNGTPNTATLRVSGFTPVKGQEIKMGLGALDAARYIFCGHILAVTQVYEANNPANVAWDLRCISYEWLLNRRKVVKQYTAESATDIVLDLMSSFTSGFTTANVEAGLPVIDAITFTNEDVTDALDRIAQRIGAAGWLVDYGKDLHFGFLVDEGAAHDITDADRVGASALAPTVDLSEVRTRAYVEGGGSVSLGDVVAGSTLLPVEDPSWYNAAGGTVMCGAQRIDYAAVVTGGAGALAGTGVNKPTNSPECTLEGGGLVPVGVVGYAASFVTAAGRTLVGPTRTVTVGGTSSAPATGPTATKQIGGDLSAGAYEWACTFVDSAGHETTGGPVGSATMDDIAAPSGSMNLTSSSGGSLTSSKSYAYQVTFYTASGETTGGVLRSQTLGASDTAVSMAGIPVSSDSNVVGRKIYRKDWNSATFKLLTTLANNTARTYTDTAADGTLGATMPTVNTATYRSAALSAIPVSSDPDIVSVNVYRTTAGGSTLDKVTTLSNGTRTYTDNIADASLGSTIPSSNTTTKRKVLIGVPVSDDPAVTDVELYRKDADNGNVLKYLTSVTNGTTSYTDQTQHTDITLAPSSDTSGISASDGTINAGVTSITISSDLPFESGGGWAIISSQVIKYTGKTTNTLTGIPATGAGALLQSVRYGQQIAAASLLTGIPASGAGAIAYDITKGDQVNVFVQADDTDAQAALAALVGGDDDGIVEDYIQDGRLSETEALNRAEAQVALLKDPLVTVQYATRDRSTQSGRTVTFDLAAPTSVSGTYRIQSVEIGEFDPRGRAWPLRRVTASSRRRSLDQLLALIKGT